eukprot:GDKI01019671.1.p1 GENE.GDKI01019671.1~~GDKI01019671.1.p1  ORF type:complete len:386 (+),score=90.61 GDKI01019671.1:82-1239(+)
MFVSRIRCLVAYSQRLPSFCLNKPALKRTSNSLRLFSTRSIPRNMATQQNGPAVQENKFGVCMHKCEAYEQVKKDVIDRFDAFIFDMDGVLWEGEHMIPGAVECVHHLHTTLGKKVFFCTNNSMASRKEYVSKLTKLGFANIHEDMIYCASSATANYLRSINYTGKTYVIGASGLFEELASVPGIEIIDPTPHHTKFPYPNQMAKEDVPSDIKAVVMGFDPLVNYYKIAYAGIALHQNPDALFIVTNRDRHYPSGNGRRLPGTGAFIAAMEITADRPPLLVGKPGPFIIEDICRLNHLDKSRVCMIGDNLWTDIEFGVANGIASLMVETGVSKVTDLDKPEHQHRLPHFILPSVANFLPDELRTQVRAHIDKKETADREFMKGGG